MTSRERGSPGYGVTRLLSGMFD